MPSGNGRFLKYDKNKIEVLRKNQLFSFQRTFFSEAKIWSKSETSFLSCFGQKIEASNIFLYNQLRIEGAE